MGVSIIENDSFHGVRIYIKSRALDKPIQKYFSFKKDGKLMSRPQQNRLRRQVEAEEAELRYRLNLPTGNTDRKRKLRRKGFPESPIPFSNMNIQIESATGVKTAPVWIKEGHFKFMAYPPFIHCQVLEGRQVIEQKRFRFTCLEDFPPVYAAACLWYAQRHDIDIRVLEDGCPASTTIRRYLKALTNQKWKPEGWNVEI